MFGDGSQSPLQDIIVNDNVEKTETVQETIPSKGKNGEKQEQYNVDCLQAKYVDIRIC